MLSPCPDSYFAQEQFLNSLVQNKNFNFTRQSENSNFAQDNSRIVPIPTLGRTYTMIVKHNDHKPSRIHIAPDKVNISYFYTKIYFVVLIRSLIRHF